MTILEDGTVVKTKRCPLCREKLVVYTHHYKCATDGCANYEKSLYPVLDEDVIG